MDLRTYFTSKESKKDEEKIDDNNNLTNNNNDSSKIINKKNEEQKISKKDTNQQNNNNSNIKINDNNNNNDNNKDDDEEEIPPIVSHKVEFTNTNTNTKEMNIERLNNLYGYNINLGLIEFWEWISNEIHFTFLNTSKKRKRNSYGLNFYGLKKSERFEKWLYYTLNMKLVGPFDVLRTNQLPNLLNLDILEEKNDIDSDSDSDTDSDSDDELNNTLNENEKNKLHCHLSYRFVYDPPEFQTLLIGSLNTHWGYFHDEPNESPNMIIFSDPNQNKGQNMNIISDNIFGMLIHALEHYLRNLHRFENNDNENESNNKEKKNDDDSILSFFNNNNNNDNNNNNNNNDNNNQKKKRKRRKLSEWDKRNISTLIDELKKKADKLGFHYNNSNFISRSRKKKIIGSTLSSLGIVVPYNPRTELGYRETGFTQKEFRLLLSKVRKARLNETQQIEAKKKYDILIDHTNISNDECDFGMGLEVGLNLLSYSTIFHRDALSILLPTYSLLNRPLYEKIILKQLSNTQSINENNGKQIF